MSRDESEAPENESPTGDFAEAPPEPQQPDRKGGGFARKLGISLIIGTVLWVAGAALVISWQPGRFVQIGIVGLMVIAAFLIPRKHTDRILAAFACLLLVAALFYAPSFLLTDVVEFTVRGTDRDSHADIYLVHTDYGADGANAAGEPFSNSDAPLLWKVNSTDVQGQADALKGQRVRARVYGFRIADLSKYRNIIWMEPIE